MTKIWDWLGVIRLLWSLFRLKRHVDARRTPWPAKQWIAGHRGARDLSAENTLTGFSLALASGADGVEFDVRLSKDGIPMIIHDETVDRTTDGQGEVSLLSAKSMAGLNAAKTYAGQTPEGIPTLEEALAILPDGAIANVEIKRANNFTKQEYVSILLPILRGHQYRLTLIISSFDGELLSIFRKENPSFLIGALFSLRDDQWPESIRYLPMINPDALHLPEPLALDCVRRMATHRGLRLAIWTVNDINRMRQWLRSGIDGIFTDRVSLIRKLRS